MNVLFFSYTFIDSHVRLEKCMADELYMADKLYMAVELYMVTLVTTMEEIYK